MINLIKLALAGAQKVIQAAQGLGTEPGTLRSTDSSRVSNER